MNSGKTFPTVERMRGIPSNSGKMSRFREHQSLEEVAKRRKSPSHSEKGFGACFRLGMSGGARRNRTDDLLNAIQALSQLSYDPTGKSDLGLAGLSRPAAGGRNVILRPPTIKLKSGLFLALLGRRAAVEITRDIAAVLLLRHEEG